MEGTFLYDTILPWFPGGPEWFLLILKVIALPVVTIHLTEAYLFDKKKLRKYNVQKGTGLWWKWIVSCFIEGYGCFQRIDAMVKIKEREAEKASH
jgi:hypothetical protein